MAVVFSDRFIFLNPPGCPTGARASFLFTSTGLPVQNLELCRFLQKYTLKRLRKGGKNFFDNQLKKNGIQ